MNRFEQILFNGGYDIVEMQGKVANAWNDKIAEENKYNYYRNLK